MKTRVHLGFKTSLAIILFYLACIGGWITHVVWWINLLITDQIDTIGEGVLAILGTIVAPVGIVHGFIIWF